MNNVDKRIDMGNAIDSFLDELTPEQRSAVNLVWLNGYSAEEAAKYLGITPRAIFSRLEVAKNIARANPEIRLVAKDYGVL